VVLSLTGILEVRVYNSMIVVYRGYYNPLCIDWERW